MIDLNKLTQKAALRVRLREGRHSDFVSQRFSRDLPQPLPAGSRLLWGPNDLGSFPVLAAPDLRSLLFTVTVEVARVALDDQSLFRFGPGTVLPLNKPLGSPFDLVIGDLVVAQGQVVSEDHFSLLIGEVLDRPRRPLVWGHGPTELQIVLGNGQLMGAALADLTSGQVVSLENGAQPFAVLLDGRPLASAEVFATQDGFFLRIRSLEASPNPRLPSHQELVELAESTMTTIGDKPSVLTPKEREDLVDLFEADVRPPASAANRSRALWCHLQIERKHPERAAALIAGLKTDDAVEVVRLLGEEDAPSLVGHLASGPLDLTSASAAYEAWSQTCSLVTSAFGDERAVDLINRASASARSQTPLNRVSARRLAGLLVNEHPQTAAVVLARLDPGQGIAVLEAMPVTFSAEIVRRLATLRPVGVDAFREVERVLERLVLSSGREAEADAVAGVAAVLGLLDRGDPVARRAMIELLEETDPDLARRLNDE